MPEIKFTEWWRELSDHLVSIQGAFPSKDWGTHPLLSAGLEMAAIGQTLETLAKETWTGRNLQEPSNKMTLAQQRLGCPIDGLAYPYRGSTYTEKNFIPVCDSPLDAIFCLAYYEHLSKYKDVKSDQKLLQEGMPSLGYPGIRHRKDIMKIHANTLKEKIRDYLRDSNNVKALAAFHPTFITVSEISDPEQQFTVFYNLVLGFEAPRLSLIVEHPPEVAATVATPEQPTKSFAEKLGERLVLQFKQSTQTSKSQAIPHEFLRQEMYNKLKVTTEILESIYHCQQVNKWIDVKLNGHEVDVNLEAFVQCGGDRGTITLFEEHVSGLHNQAGRENVSVVGTDSPNISPPIIEEPPKTAGSWWEMLGRTYSAVAGYLWYGKPPVIEPSPVAHPAAVDASQMNAQVPAIAAMKKMTSDILEANLRKLNEGDIQFDSRDIHGLSEKSIELFALNAKLYTSVLVMDTNLSDYLKSQSLGGLGRVIFGVFQKLNAFEIPFMSTYFIPNQWKFMYSARKMLVCIEQLKSDFSKKQLSTEEELVRVKGTMHTAMEEAKTKILSVSTETKPYWFTNEEEQNQARLIKEISTASENLSKK